MEQRKHCMWSAFSYTSTIPEGVQALFSDVVEKNTTVDFAYDIVNAGMEGRIDLNRDFNLAGYCYKIKSTNEMYVKPTKQKKETFISADDSDYEGTAQKGGVQLNKIKKLEESFDEIEDNSELIYAINTIQSLQKDFLIQEGINLKVLITRAIEGVPTAIKNLKILCEDFELVGEQVKVILSSGREFSSCLC